MQSLCLSQTRQLVTVCDSKLLTTAIQALSAARPEFIASRGSPSAHDTERVVLRNDQGSPQAKWSGKGNRASMNLNWQEEEWVRFTEWHYFLMILPRHLQNLIYFCFCFRKRSGSMWIRVWSVWSAVWTGCWRESARRATAAKTSSCLTSRLTPAREVARAMHSGSTLVTVSQPPLPHHTLFQLSPLHHYYHHPHHPYWTLHAHPVITHAPVGFHPVLISILIPFKTAQITHMLSVLHPLSVAQVII